MKQKAWKNRSLAAKVKALPHSKKGPKSWVSAQSVMKPDRLKEPSSPGPPPKALPTTQAKDAEPLLVKEEPSSVPERPSKMERLPPNSIFPSDPRAYEVPLKVVHKMGNHDLQLCEIMITNRTSLQECTKVFKGSYLGESSVDWLQNRSIYMRKWRRGRVTNNQRAVPTHF
jgi:hypothetical protein